jgi:hypothetical protein
MATYVNDLRLKEIGTGESSGTWGTETNVNLELIGEALGYATKALADASTGTLTIPDGTATNGESRALYLKLTGGGQAQTVTLAPNTVSKTWIIDNGTSYTLTFSQGSGANVAIAAGQTKVIATDGAGSGAAIYDCFADLELAGAVTAATSFTAPLIEGSTSIQTPLIEYTDGDDAITIADGGGLTFASTTQANGTLTVGIDNTGQDVKFFGATSGSYMLWDESADDLKLVGAAGLTVAGTALVTGVLTTTATQVATGGITSGSNILSDTDSTDDLGTTSVRWANLFVDGITATDQITATGFTGTLDGILGSGAAAAATLTTLDTSGAVNLNLTTDSTSSTSGALIIDGGVGVAKKLFVGTDLDVDGTTNLDAMDVDGAVNFAADVTYADGADIITASAGTSNFRAGVNAGNSIASGGNYNVVVGDEAGTAITTGDNNVALGSYALDANTTGASNCSIGLNAGGGITTGNHNIGIGNNTFVETVVLTTGGQNIIIGNFSRTDAVDSTYAIGLGYNISAASGYTTLGNAGADIRAAHGNVTWATVSDERYKKDIVDSEAGLSLINALRPRTFKYRTLGELPETFNAYEADSTEVFKNADTNHGFIAQEVKAAIDADSSIKDGFRLWDDRSDGSQEVAEAALIPILVKAIQELTARITTLEG